MGGVCRDWNDPNHPRPECSPHPNSNLTLWSWHSFNNQPHIATYELYMGTVWATVPYARTVIEHHANAFAWRERDWNGWLYADGGLGKVFSHLGIMAGVLPSGRHVKLSSNRWSGNMSIPAELDIPSCVPNCQG